MTLGVLVLMLLVGAAIYGVMAWRGEPLATRASQQLADQTGQSLVNALNARLARIAGTTSSMAGLAASMPPAPALFKQVMPDVIDQGGQTMIAGGGIWPEPGAFTPGVTKRSFFWTRGDDGALAFSDAYNQPDASAYQNDDWYSAARGKPPGQCVWSPAYRDPTSGVAMVTCSVPYYREDNFAGVATIDLKLDGMADFLAANGGATGGYAFALDGNGQIIDFPGLNAGGSDMTRLASLTQTHAWLAPVVQAMSEAAGPQRVAVDTAGELNEPASVRWFHMPGPGWTLGLVTPQAQITALSSHLTGTLLLYILPLLALALGFAWWSGRRLVARINDTTRRIENLGESEGMAKLDIHRRDEIGALGQAVNRYTDKLKALFDNVRASSATVAEQANQLSAGNLELSSRTEEQAASLEQTSATMEELASTVKSNADNAREADERMRESSNAINEGSGHVAQLVTSMNKIEDSSSRITSIVDVIEDIAFQTNLLALNASVEAARAGEHGRGFAVVAAEVRKLASRSASSASEISQLIEQASSEIRTGGGYAESAERAMSGIVASVDEIARRVREISEASQEQANGIEEVNRAVSQMDEVTQQNASFVTEGSKDIDKLAVQAQRLARLVDDFQQAASTAAKPRSADTVEMPIEPALSPA